MNASNESRAHAHSSGEAFHQVGEAGEPYLHPVSDDALLRRLGQLSDDILLERLADLVRDSRRVEAHLVAHIGEVDSRRLYARFAVPSMFVYCTERLHLSEAEAYLRITAARAARQHPVLLSMLAEGRLHLTGIALLAPHLTSENRDAVLSRAAYRSKQQIQGLLAELFPRPDVPATVRRLPVGRSVGVRGGAETSATAAARDAVADQHRSGADDVRGLAGIREPADSAATDNSRGGGVLVEGELQLRPDGVGAASAEADARGESSHPEAPGRKRNEGSAVEPMAPHRYRVQFTAGQELRDKLARLQALMRHSVPDGDLAAVIEVAVTEKLARLETRRYGAACASRRPSGPSTRSGPADADGRAKDELSPDSSLPRSKTGRGTGQTAGPVADVNAHPSGTRHIPVAVRRAVWARDGNRCRYVDERGRRCTEERRLEFHHRRPYGYGGEHAVDNVALLCRTHNAYLARVDYGEAAIRRQKQPSRPR